MNIFEEKKIIHLTFSELFFASLYFIVDKKEASTSLIQRKFSIGYNRASCIIDELEHRGVIGPFEGSRPRQVLINDIEHAELLLRYWDKEGIEIKDPQRYKLIVSRFDLYKETEEEVRLSNENFLSKGEFNNCKKKGAFIGRDRLAELLRICEEEFLLSGFDLFRLKNELTEKNEFTIKIGEYKRLQVMNDYLISLNFNASVSLCKDGVL